MITAAYVFLHCWPFGTHAVGGLIVHCSSVFQIIHHCSSPVPSLRHQHRHQHQHQHQLLHLHLHQHQQHQCPVSSVQCPASCVHCRVQFLVLSGVPSVQSPLFSVQCAMSSAQCAVSSVQCPVSTFAYGFRLKRGCMFAQPMRCQTEHTYICTYMHVRTYVRMSACVICVALLG